MPAIEPSPRAASAAAVAATAGGGGGSASAVRAAGGAPLAVADEPTMVPSGTTRETSVRARARPARLVVRRLVAAHDAEALLGDDRDLDLGAQQRH